MGVRKDMRRWSELLVDDQDVSYSKRKGKK